MIRDRLLVDRSDGTWEITDEGRAWLKNIPDPPKTGFHIEEIG